MVDFLMLPISQVCQRLKILPFLFQNMHVCQTDSSASARVYFATKASAKAKLV